MNAEGWKHAHDDPSAGVRLMPSGVEPCAGCGHTLHTLNGGVCWVIMGEVNDGPIYCSCGRPA